MKQDLLSVLIVCVCARASVFTNVEYISTAKSKAAFTKWIFEIKKKQTNTIKQTKYIFFPSVSFLWRNACTNCICFYTADTSVNLNSIAITVLQIFACTTRVDLLHKTKIRFRCIFIAPKCAVIIKNLLQCVNFQRTEYSTASSNHCLKNTLQNACKTVRNVLFLTKSIVYGNS